MERTLAIITARGGSKRIPKKNIKDFCGKPIIAYSIEAALKSGIFDEVMVSTDSQEIADIAIQYGAKIPFLRTEKTSDDFATTADVLTEVLEQYREKGKTYEYICCIYPTAPFVTSEKLRSAMDLLINNKAMDAAIPVVKFSFPPQRALILENQEVKILNPDIYQMRSQDLEGHYHECGQYYCLKVESFLKTQRLVLEHTIPIITSEMEVQDIDDEIDWKIAELKYKIMKEQ